MTAPPPHEIPTVAIGGLTIHDLSFDQVVAWIVETAERRRGGFVCTPNADYVVRANRDAEFRHAIQAAALRVPDGMWIVYASRLAGRPLHGTVTGRLLVPAVGRASAVRGLRMALFGAGPGIAQAAAARLHREVPGLTIAAAVTPPYPLDVGSPTDQSLVDNLISTDPDVVFVSLGAPRQELWMAEHADAFRGAVLVGVGAALDILAGRFREAPGWMTRLGFEWLYRLAQEPRRLARRYLIDDPWILWWAVRTRVTDR